MKNLKRKLQGVAICVTGILLLFLFLLNFPTFPQTGNSTFGFTFSTKQAESLSLDWKKAYVEIISNFSWEYVRIPVYWDRIESVEGITDFEELDYMLQEAAAHKVGVTLAIGHKVPRWPECHDPSWTNVLTKKELIEKLFRFDEKIIEHYKDHPALSRWQVENELLFPFGTCKNYFGLPTLAKEIQLVRTLDKTHPIMVTDSGEWTVWIPMAAYGDVLGSSLYREAWNNTFGHVPFPISPGYYQFRKQIVKTFFGKEVIVSELQGEPWGSKNIHEMTIGEMKDSMPLKKLEKNIAFTKEVGFSEIGLWGVEWWYWLKQNGEPSYWEKMQQIIKQ